MKFRLMLALVPTVLLFQPNLRAKESQFLSAPAYLDGDWCIRQFEVLDINFDKGLLAYRYIFCGDGYDCKYGGMKKYPGTGVALGILDLNAKNQPRWGKHFIVYDPAKTKQQCTRKEVAKKRLEKAKNYFKSQGLDVYRKPPALELPATIKNVAGQAINLTEQLQEEFDDESFKPFKQRFPDENPEELVVCDFYAGKKRVYRSIRFTHDPNAQCNNSISGVYHSKNKVVFIEKVFCEVGMAGVHDDLGESLAFINISPMVQLK